MVSRKYATRHNRCRDTLYEILIILYSFVVYVFLGEHDAMIDMLANLEERGLLASGKYIVIYTHLETFDSIDKLRYFKRKLSRSPSLLTHLDPCGICGAAFWLRAHKLW